MHPITEIATQLLGPAGRMLDDPHTGSAQLMLLDGTCVWSGDLALSDQHLVAQIAERSKTMVVVCKADCLRPQDGIAAWASNGQRIYAPRSLRD